MAEQHLSVLVVDDAHYIGAAVTGYLAQQAREDQPEWLVESVPTVRDVEDFATELDLRMDVALVDLVLDIRQGGSTLGGLSAIHVLAKHRPDVPVLVHCAVENNSDRLLPALASLNWFGNVVGFLPKVLGPGTRDVSRFMADSLLAAIDGTFSDPVTEMARHNAEAVDALLDQQSDLARWRAIVRTESREAAAVRANISTTALTNWCLAVAGTLDELWDDAVEVGIASADHWQRHAGVGRRRVYEEVKEFGRRYRSFFDDPYLDERFGA